MPDPDPEGPLNVFEWFLRSPLSRVLSILLLLLVLRIPVAMVRELIQERQLRREQAVAEVTGKWGQEQSLVGPFLVVPFSPDGGRAARPGSERFAGRRATFLPEVLEVEGFAESRTLRRGIFDIPLYETRLRVSGRFGAPDFSDWVVAPEGIRWERAELAVGISDPRVIQDSVVLTLGDAQIPFSAGFGVGDPGAPGIHAALPADVSGGAGFAFELRLHGSDGLYFTPLGGETSVRLGSDWPHPSFQGRWLPSERSVSEGGFEARWHVPSLGRSYPGRWSSDASPGDRIASSRFGVEFATPIDPYRLSERSVKYDALFLGLTFLALWLFEVLAGVRVHAVQYGMVGAAMALFYLLLLALSEHLGFALAYALAAGGIVVLIAAYAISILRERRRGVAIGGVVTLLYGYLFVLLHDQDHALLAGSIGLFGILAAVMWLTRNVDWDRAVRGPARVGR